jgi:hypothetical protein
MNFKKIIFVLFLALMVQFVFGLTVLAAEDTIPFRASIWVPAGDGSNPVESVEIRGDFSALTEYISRIYRFGMAITGILAVIVLALGGITWLTSGGNANSIAKAKQYIWGSITGLVLALLSYTILNMVNPDIVALKRPPAITQLSSTTKGCGWQKTACDPRFQVSTQRDICGNKPLLNNKPDGSYIHCCCGLANGCCVEKEQTATVRVVIDCYSTSLDICDGRQDAESGIFTAHHPMDTCSEIPSCVAAGFGSDCTDKNYGSSCGDFKVCGLDTNGFPGCIDCVTEGPCDLQAGVGKKCCSGFYCENKGNLAAFKSSFGIGDGQYVCAPNETP